MHHQPNRTSTSIRQRHFLLAKHKRSSLFLKILKQKKEQSLERFNIVISGQITIIQLSFGQPNTNALAYSSK
jgi:hypothetical protein